MSQQQAFQDKASVIYMKKKYSKPVLTILGKVSELTAGGSGRRREWGNSNRKKRRP